MNSEDLHYVKAALAGFIDSAINRVAESGRMSYRFRIDLAEFKAQTGRRRMHDSVTDEMVAFFERQGISASHDAGFNEISLTLDLSRVTLTPAESRYLAVAMEKNRADNA